MDSDLQKKLYDDYPNLFSNKNKSIRESCMAWGIECGNGWFSIIESVCNTIHQYEEFKKDTQYHPVKFDQVKEKYGGLRIYFSGGDEYVEGIISMAEAMSYKICEICSNKGETNKGGWISTLCEDCRIKK